MKTEEPKPKRFYETVSVQETDGRFEILLDGRVAKTLGGKALAAPNADLAAAVMNEWDAQKDHIDRKTMRLTGILSAAIDGGKKGRKEWIDEILSYLGSDLVCYRADMPEALNKAQAACWEPYIDFMRNEFGAMLVSTTGVVAIGQPDATFSTMRKVLEAEPSERLFALQIATAISGSAVLAMALWKGFKDAEEIFNASRVDEHFQQERWGVDDEAKAREEVLRNDFLTTANFLSLL
ncbi:ATP12 family chaperone protein [Hyphococcus sp. DH-69]|uniref:ATP12 family chaperone protein n=1 Tax=Hyphococcus formosus TaxID=3143534 RepID=UPI00398A9DF2